MRGTWLSSIALVLACGAEPRAPEPVAPIAAPVPDPIPVPAPAAECTASSECSFTIDPDVTTEADCACPSCRSDAMSLARMSEIAERYQRVCGGWLAAHACPVPTCSDRLAVCIDGRCFGGPIAEADGRPSPCRTPDDCGGHARCVIHALGGTFGCTNEACCGTAECSNGCTTDADCPSCRPTCDQGSCRL